MSVAAFEALPYAQAGEYLRAVEGAGVEMVWYGEVLGREAFTVGLASLAATSRLVVGTGVARALERGPKSAAAASSFLWEAFPGRYVLGLGVSGASRERGLGPMPFMRGYLDELDQNLERTGVRERPPRILGAYSEGLTKLARDRTDGLMTFMVTPSHTTWARSVLGADPFLGVGCRVIFDEDPGSARALAREKVAYYLGLPHQQNKLLKLGFTDEDFSYGGSDRLIDAMFAWGSPEQVAHRLGEHLAAGADQVTVGLEQGPRADLLDNVTAVQRLLGEELDPA